MNADGDELHFEGAQFFLGAGERGESVDGRFLISLLLITVAKGDGSISNLETDKMIELLSARYDDQSPKVMEALSRAVMLLANDSDLTLTLRKVSESLSPGDKEEVFDLATEVAAVDGHLDEGEMKALDLVGQILGLTQDSVHTRLRALRSQR